MVTVTTQGTVNDFIVDEPTSISLSSNGDLIYSRANELISVRDCERVLAARTVASKTPSATAGTAAASSRGSGAGMSGSAESMAEMPTEDISTKMRRRVLAGYCMEIEKNLELCT